MQESRVKNYRIGHQKKQQEETYVGLPIYQLIKLNL